MLIPAIILWRVLIFNSIKVCTSIHLPMRISLFEICFLGIASHFLSPISTAVGCESCQKGHTWWYDIFLNLSWLSNFYLLSANIFLSNVIRILTFPFVFIQTGFRKTDESLLLESAAGVYRSFCFKFSTFVIWFYLYSANVWSTDRNLFNLLFFDSATSCVDDKVYLKRCWKWYLML